MTKRWILVFTRKPWEGACLKQELPPQDRASSIVVTRLSQAQGLQAEEFFYVLEDQEIGEDFRWIGELIQLHNARPYVWQKDRPGRERSKL